MAGLIIWLLLIFFIAFSISPGLLWFFLILLIIAGIIYLIYTWISYKMGTARVNRIIREREIKKAEAAERERQRVEAERIRKENQFKHAIWDYCQNYGLEIENLENDILTLKDNFNKFRMTVRVELDEHSGIIFKEIISKESI